jgi:hypothetical protein
MASPIGESGLIGQSDDSVDAVFIQGNYAYINTGPMLTILDISDPLHPAPVGSTELPEPEGPGFPRGFVSDIYVVDGYAYVAAYESGLRIIDVSDPTTPLEVGVYQPPLQNWNDFPLIRSPDPPRYMFQEGARGVVVRREATGQTYTYVAAYAAGLRVVDVSDPTTPIEVGICEYELPAAPTAVTVRDNYAYVAAGKGGLRVMDISDPTAIVEISASTTALNWSWDVVVADRDSSRLAYLAEGNCDGMWGCHGGLHVVDVSSPDSPTQIVPASTSGGISLAIALAEDYAYLTGWNALRAIDLSEPTRSVGRWSTQNTSIFIKDVSLVDSYAYLAAGREGLQILPISNLSTPSETKSGTGGPEHSPWTTHNSGDELDGQFSIQYPADYELIHEVPSVDGIWTTMTNTASIVSRSPAFALSIQHNAIEAGTSLAQFVDQNNQCVEISAEQGQPFTLGGQEALIFVDTNCGPVGSTEIYTLHNDFGYRVWVQSSAKYEQIKEYIEPILLTFKFTSMEE